MVGTAFDDGVNNQTAFVSDPTGMTSTDLNTQITNSAWVLTEAHAINKVGQIAGSGYLNGVPTAFLLTPDVLPPPPPQDAVLALLIDAVTSCAWAIGRDAMRFASLPSRRRVARSIA